MQISSNQDSTDWGQFDFSDLCAYKVMIIFHHINLIGHDNCYSNTKTLMWENPCGSGRFSLFLEFSRTISESSPGFRWVHNIWNSLSIFNLLLLSDTTIYSSPFCVWMFIMWMLIFYPYHVTVLFFDWVVFY